MINQIYPPSMIITVDTEGDNLWSRPHEIKTTNVNYITRFQELCEKFNFKPTYLTNYEMTQSECFIDFGRKILTNQAGEIGMHLHAWNSPPIVPLTQDDYYHQPYLIEYSRSILNDKLRYMTELLEDRFDTKMRSHRSGRWGFNSVYAKSLANLGYSVDCSVTPHVSWRKNKGCPNGSGGTDYLDFPDDEYFLDFSDISKAGDTRLLEVPMTIFPKYKWLNYFTSKLYFINICRSIHRRNNYWLRPNGMNIKKLMWVVNNAKKRNKNYIQFTLHSSELMPGGSPYFRDIGSIEQLYIVLEELFIHIKENGFIGRTLHQHYQNIITF